VISFGGFMGLGNSHYPIPWNALSYDTSLGGFKTNITEQQLKDMPNDSWQDRDWETRTHQYYRVRPYWEASLSLFPQNHRPTARGRAVGLRILCVFDLSTSANFPPQVLLFEINSDVKVIILEYLNEKLAGIYGHKHARAKRFSDRSAAGRMTYHNSNKDRG
jgi:hypothetical protein